MGCWNHTCAITNLPVFAGEDVVVFALKQKGYIGPNCYVDTFWRPYLYHFEGKYNDYGAVEECHGPGLEPLLDEIRRDLHEMELGENQYHDIPVKREGFGINQFFEADHERRLFSKNIHYDSDPESCRPRLVQTTHVVVRKNVFDAILAKHTIQTYEGYDDVAKSSVYKTYTFAELHETFFQMILKAKEALALYAAEYDKLGLHTPHAYLELKISFTEQCKHSHPIYWVVEAPFYGVLETLADLLQANATDDQIKAFAHQALVRYWMESVMQGSRRMWCPPSGSGSQDQDTDVQTMLAQITIDEAQVVNHFYDEDEEDDDD